MVNVQMFNYKTKIMFIRPVPDKAKKSFAFQEKTLPLDR